VLAGEPRMRDAGVPKGFRGCSSHVLQPWRRAACRLMSMIDARDWASSGGPDGRSNGLLESCVASKRRRRRRSFASGTSAASGGGQGTRELRLRLLGARLQPALRIVPEVASTASEESSSWQRVSWTQRKVADEALYSFGLPISERCLWHGSIWHGSGSPCE
jgi:hypothetical protein